MIPADLFGPFRTLAALPGTVIETEEPFHGFSGAVYARLVERISADLRWYLSHAPGPAGTLLDLCCGSGRYLAAFAAAGWQATGVDTSAAMLDRARARVGGAAAVELLRADALTLSLGRAVDCVLIGGLSLPMFDATGRAALLGTARRHLRPGGTLLLDYSPRDVQCGDGGDIIGIPLRMAGGTGFAWIGWQRSDLDGRQRTNIYGELIAAHGTRRFLSSVSIELPTPQQLAGELAAHGFGIRDQARLHAEDGTARLSTALLACEVLP